MRMTNLIQHQMAMMKIAAAIAAVSCSELAAQQQQQQRQRLGLATFISSASQRG
jgi:hypothetical protein